MSRQDLANVINGHQGIRGRPQYWRPVLTRAVSAIFSSLLWCGTYQVECVARR